MGTTLVVSWGAKNLPEILGAGAGVVVAVIVLFFSLTVGFFEELVHVVRPEFSLPEADAVRKFFEAGL